MASELMGGVPTWTRRKLHEHGLCAEKPTQVQWKVEFAFGYMG